MYIPSASYLFCIVFLCPLHTFWILLCSFFYCLNSTLFTYLPFWYLLCSFSLLSGLYFVHLSPFLVSFFHSLDFTLLSYHTLWTLQYFVPCRLCLYSTLFIYLTFWTLLFFFPSLSGLSFVHLSYFVDSTFFFFSLSGHYFVHLFCYRIRIMNAVSWAGTCWAGI